MRSRYIPSIVALLAALMTAPWSLMLIAMGYDERGSSWGWLHTVVAGLPVSLCIVSVTSLRWATHGDRLPLFAGLALLALDVSALALLWVIA
ncbi:hypothetical protein ACQKKX_18950 [Neorhizobium sp. NPDC001467]|uniref:hypothetical protein n=1 Tax=Neorhizobium sp. NPDC001467 TaxID=3390595 RepID=UPI003CFC517D